MAQNPLKQKLFAGFIFLVCPHQERTEEAEHLVQLKVKAQLIQVSAVKTYQKGKRCGSKEWSFCKNSCRVLDREVSLKGALWMVSFLQTISSVYP